jgi:hypothetical protein
MWPLRCRTRSTVAAPQSGRVGAAPTAQRRTGDGTVKAEKAQLRTLTTEGCER